MGGCDENWILLQRLLRIHIDVSGSGRLAAQVPLTPGEPELEFSPDSATLVLSYHVIQHMLEGRDPTPLIRIYGDGRVLVHYPVYMQRAGDYELQLTRQELRQLLVSMAQQGVVDFNPENAAAEKRAVMQQLAQRGEVAYVSDAAETVMDIRLTRYKPAGGFTTSLNLQKTVRWNNVAQEARLFPTLSSVGGLANAERQIRGLLDRNDLRRAR